MIRKRFCDLNEGMERLKVDGRMLLELVEFHGLSVYAHVSATSICRCNERTGRIICDEDFASGESEDAGWVYPGPSKRIGNYLPSIRFDSVRGFMSSLHVRKIIREGRATEPTYSLWGRLRLSGGDSLKIVRHVLNGGTLYDFQQNTVSLVFSGPDQTPSSSSVFNVCLPEVNEVVFRVADLDAIAPRLKPGAKEPIEPRSDLRRNLELIIAALWAKAHGDGGPGRISSKPTTAAKSIASLLENTLGSGAPGWESIRDRLDDSRAHGIPMGSSHEDS